MKVIIDRFESHFAVCENEDRQMINIEREKLPPGAKEGDILVIDNDAITINLDETARRKESIGKLMDDLWE